MRVRWLVAACAFALLCGTPLASAMTDRSLRLLDGSPPEITVPSTITQQATSGDGITVDFASQVTFSDPDGDLATSGCDPASGSLFPVATTTVTCTATDSLNNSASASFDVVVTPPPPPPDTTPPVLSLPGNLTGEASGPAGATVNFEVSATDNVDPSPTVSCDHSSGTFAITTTTVTCTATDASGNHSSGGFTITVHDTTAPSISVPGTITTPAAGAGGAIVSFTVTASDAVTSSPTITCDHNTGDMFPVGTTTVSCTAKDGANNTSAAAFDVTVQDQTAPTITVPASFSREATSGSGAVVTFTVTANDAVDSTPTITCDHPSGSTLPIGVTHNSCTARDDAGNVSTPGTFDITVQDNTAPALTVPASFTTGATGPGGASVSYTVSATDLIDPSPTVTCSKNSGANFPLGTTTVSCTAKDFANNASAAKTFNVTVADQIPPTVSVPGPITKEATSGSGASVTFVVTATDAVDPSPTITCNPTSGGTFALGTTHVSCTAKDGSNNTSAPATFDVNVIDTTPPVVSSVPADKTVEANGFAGSIVDFVPPTAVDLGEPRLVTCAPARNSTFALGTTTVTCSASDASGNTGTAMFKINVVDTTPPTLIPPGDFTAYAVEDAGTLASDDSIHAFIFGAHVSDIADPHPTLVTDTPSLFPVGTTTVHFIATDASGNKTKAEAKLTIRPKPAPGTKPPALPPPTDNTPPANVTGLTGKGGDRRATLKWTNPKNSDFAAVEIERGTNAAFSSGKVTGTVVYHGTGTSYLDKGLTNDVSYRYVVHSLDKNGNKSEGVPVNVTPHLQLLKTPPDGARLAAIPKKFVWVRDPKASYYNFQLFLGGSLVLQSTNAEPRKILSTWTIGPSLNFKSPWKWEGKSYKIAKGTYTWYVWPGYGARADVRYGPLMGSATFQITKTPKPAKPKKKKK